MGKNPEKKPSSITFQLSRMRILHLHTAFPWSFGLKPQTLEDSRFQSPSFQGLEIKEIFHIPLKYYSLHSLNKKKIADILR